MASVLENAIKVVEAQLDDELERLQNPDEEELSRIRNARLKEYKEREKNHRTWLELGHGEYSEISSEQDFFPAVKKSDKVVVHFYRPSAFRCSIVDKHLKLLAPKHLETKFLKLDAEKAPFLTGKLGIKVIPTILCIVDSNVKDRIVGFTDLGNCDDFGTDMMEWRLGFADVINYSGDKSTPPDPKAPKKTTMTVISKTIRGSKNDQSDEDE